MYPQATCPLLLIFFVLFMLKKVYRSMNSNLQSQLTTLLDIHELLAPAGTSLFSQLEARAAPNVRLVRAFDIHNTFTSADPSIHAVFVKKTKSLISPPSNNSFDWLRFSHVAVDAISAYLPNAMLAPVAFDTVMRTVTLRTILVGLLGVDPSEVDIDFPAVDFVTRGINELWRLSKTTSALPPNLLSEVNEHLRHWVSDVPNPLEFIIPAYETMWRVVALTVALTHSDAKTRENFRDYLEQPFLERFRHFPHSGPSVEAIIQEILRLYPPTRHISRTIAEIPVPSVPSFLGCRFSRTVTKVADIETIQRDASVWGAFPHVFDPMRHHPERCVAQHWAPQAAAIIAAAILGRELEIVEGEKLGGREGWEGWTIRDIDDAQSASRMD
ncbi:hypothetical protein A0H81_04927 [Grifola frondosa]|uniref:Cytochrome P450 n=1 Tax=Grifola frondosa TaxID=5627 RepID=A0A1C7MEV5_GRIFR|nr:hypothetical protein A0H81_04927 [Grifola frondosa]